MREFVSASSQLYCSFAHQPMSSSSFEEPRKSVLSFDLPPKEDFVL